ncbi:MAG: alpha/beta fold hydrolase [Chloroflexi bacterium]|nr:alpha/beta fold hydrolase [Chloroflexota bacterium]
MTRAQGPGPALHGPPDAPSIVFVHGTRLTGSMWIAQQTALAGAYRTIAVDLPGHGRLADTPFTLEGAADVVASAIRTHARDGRAVVVGLSLGGYVAMALAAREPERVRGLVLSGASAEPVGLRSVPYSALAGVMSMADGPRLEALNAWFFRTRYPASIAEPIIAGGFWSAGGAAALRAIVGERFIPRLAAYPGPSLILNGELDLAFRLTAPAFVTAARDARRVRLAGATHLANLDRPAAFSAAIHRFADSLGGS